MSELRFTVEHEWLRLETDGSVTVGITPFAQGVLGERGDADCDATVGITPFAQNALGDVVFVQLPELARHARDAEVSVLESVKAASSINMPLDGEIVEVNAALDAAPELVNQDPLAQGWFFRFIPDDLDQVRALLDQPAYDNLIAAQG